MTIMFLVFGDQLENHLQANFAMLSFLNQEKEFNRVCIVTDRPQFYTHINQHEKVSIEEVSSETISNWMGKHKLVYRTKIKAFELLHAKYPQDDLIYLDSDTFLYASIANIKQGLNEGVNYMHLPEGVLADMKGKTPQEMYNQSKGHHFGGIEISKKHKMWNAGMIGISNKHLDHVLPKVLQTCDELCEKIDRIRLLEQLAFSLVLAETGELRASENSIAHYWGNKPGWNEVIQAFYLQSHLDDIDLNDQLKNFEKIDLKSTPIRVRYSSSREKFLKKFNGLFPIKDKYYLS